jgi:hypothetical protein
MVSTSRSIFLRASISECVFRASVDRVDRVDRSHCGYVMRRLVDFARLERRNI